MAMTLREYQDLAMLTNVHTCVIEDRPDLPLYPALGLAGESGEFVDKLKKSWRNGTPLDRESALRELGDVLWYVTACAVALAASLDDVAEMNIAKLADRAARGTLKSEGDNR